MKSSALLCSLSSATALLFSALVVTPLNAQNIVADPGFEASTDNQSGGNPFSAAWTINNGGFSTVGGNPAFARTGNNYANLGPFVGQTGSLSQVLSTTPGVFYDLSFWLANNVATGVNSFEVFWNGASVLLLNGVPAQPYTSYSITNLAVTGSSTTLEFRFRHDDDFYRLDDVSVVPEPSAVGFAALGLGLFGLAKYYRVKRQRRNA